nr:MAG TPA: hypothetical protein [Bacteriophage sp.]
MKYFRKNFFRTKKCSCFVDIAILSYSYWVVNNKF